MAAPAGGSTTTTTTVGQDEAVVNTTVPLLAPAPAAVICSSTAIGNALPRAIQLVMLIVWSGSKSSSTTTASTKTIGDYVVDRYRLILWINLVYLPSIFVASAAGIAYAILRDDAGARELISSAGGFCFLAIPVLLFVYMAVLLAAWGHLGLFAPRTPCAAWEAFHRGTCYEGFGFLVMVTSIEVMLLKVLLNQTWPLLVAWTYLLGLLVASIVAFWLCLLRTYGGDGDSSCGERVIDGLAYFYCRLLYEYAVRFHAVADADAGMQQLDAADVAVV